MSEPTKEFIKDHHRWHGDRDGCPIGEHWHWCYDWDELPIDEHDIEYDCCACYSKEEKLYSERRDQQIKLMQEHS